MFQNISLINNGAKTVEVFGIHIDNLCSSIAEKNNEKKLVSSKVWLEIFSSDQTPNPQSTNIRIYGSTKLFYEIFWLL